MIAINTQYIVANDNIAEAVWTKEVIIPTSVAAVVLTIHNKLTATTSIRLKPSWVMVQDDASFITSSRLRTRNSSSSSKN